MHDFAVVFKLTNLTGCLILYQMIMMFFVPWSILSCFSSPKLFSSFFRQIIIQLLSLAEERDVIVQNRVEFGEKDNNGALLFIGELFTRICRRGSAGN